MKRKGKSKPTRSRKKGAVAAQGNELWRPSSRMSALEYILLQLPLYLMNTRNAFEGTAKLHGILTSATGVYDRTKLRKVVDRIRLYSNLSHEELEKTLVRIEEEFL